MQQSPNGSHHPAQTPRERFLAALERRPLPGRVPHFELVFFPTMEAFGKVHPSQRSYRQWDQMTETERELHRREMAGIYVETARRFEHDAIHGHALFPGTTIFPTPLALSWSFDPQLIQAVAAAAAAVEVGRDREEIGPLEPRHVALEEQGRLVDVKPACGIQAVHQVVHHDMKPAEAYELLQTLKNEEKEKD